MTDQSKFLETEEAVAALLDELEKMNVASRRLDQAGNIVQEVTDASQKLTQWAGQILEQSNSQLTTTQNLADHMNQRLEQFGQNQNDLTQQTQRIQLGQNEQSNQITGIRQQQNEHTSQIQNVQQQQVQLETAIENLKTSQEEAKNQQFTAFQEQTDLVHQVEEKVMTSLAAVEERGQRLAKTVNILLVVSILNAILGIALLVLKLIGR